MERHVAGRRPVTDKPTIRVKMRFTSEPLLERKKDRKTTIKERLITDGPAKVAGDVERSRDDVRYIATLIEDNDLIISARAINAVEELATRGAFEHLCGVDANVNNEEKVRDMITQRLKEALSEDEKKVIASRALATIYKATGDIVELFALATNSDSRIREGAEFALGTFRRNE
ncbi:hypothetical protein JXA56_00290 [Candidatus Micrarchaeota archaeon]|nr:hypothetical protein [Candidatus Micrarchaeota archaeon]